MSADNPEYSKHFSLLKHYLVNCKQPKDKVCVEYVWIDGLQKLRSRTRVVGKVPTMVNGLPISGFECSLTGQAFESDAKFITLKPVAMFMDPFLGGENRLVLCESLLDDCTPISSNTRSSCAKVMERAADHSPEFEMAQNYSLMDLTTGRPLGWPTGDGIPGPTGPFYCGSEPGKVFGRSIAQAHLKACLHAGIKIYSVRTGAMLSQWRYEVGRCLGIDMSDQMWMSRYILNRVAADFNVGVSFDPKIIRGDQSGAGCTTYLYTEASKEKDTCAEAINGAFEKLSMKHQAHVQVYDPAGDNTSHLIEGHETASKNVFSSGVKKYIPAKNSHESGYIADKRPPPNCDPYVVCERLVKTVCLDE